MLVNYHLAKVSVCFKQQLVAEADWAASWPQFVLLHLLVGLSANVNHGGFEFVNHLQGHVVNVVVLCEGGFEVSGLSWGR